MSSLLITDHLQDIGHCPRSRLTKQGRAAFKKHMREGKARVVSTDLDLNDYREYSLELPKTPTPSNNASALKYFRPTTRWTHLVDKHGVHFASIVLPLTSEEFHQDLETVRARAKGLPRAAGANVEEL